MINLDDRILDGLVNESEMWLLLHITKFVGKNMSCWPSNKTLLGRTGWSLGKLQMVKKSLQEKGVIEISERKNEKGQTSNSYKLKTKYLSVFVNIGEKEFDEDIYTPIKNQSGVAKMPIPLSKNDNDPYTKIEHPGYQNSNNEVLTNEVLKGEVLINENKSANAHFSGNAMDYGEKRIVKVNGHLIEELVPTKITFNSGEEKTPKNKIPDVLRKSLTYTKEEFLQHLEQRGVATFYDSFKMIWADYVEHRKELRKPYKSAKSAALGFKELLELSNYNLDAATRLVERSIANGWQGLHKEKQQANNTGKNKIEQQHEDLVTYVMNKRNLLNGQ